MLAPNPFAKKSKTSAVLSTQRVPCMISSSPPYTTQQIQTTRRVVLVGTAADGPPFSPCILKVARMKKSPACTSLSKLSISRNEMCGMSCPGIAHKIKMSKAQSKAHFIFFIDMILNQLSKQISGQLRLCSRQLTAS
jgi:hypothetical protein